MVRNGKHGYGGTLLLVILAALPLLVGCGGTKASSQPEGQTVQVSVNDQRIEMPAALKPGVTTFTVVNTGTSTHNLAITGPAGEVKLEKALEPGQTGTLKVSLDAGTYRVYSPQADPTATVQIALVVRPEAPRESRG